MVIVGAGCAGLACARALADAGEQPLVLDKARGVGGRAATRRIDGQPIDHGVIFYHGSRPEFLAALDNVETPAKREGWPNAVVGDGKACVPRAFAPEERRIAFAEGITAFPKSLARALELRLGDRVSSIALGARHFELDVGGDRIETDRLVLALPAEQAQSLLDELPATHELDSVRALTRTLTTSPCLTLIAGYPLATTVPDWDVLYPAESDALLLASHDSRKRLEKKFHAFVLQCDARFSRRYEDAEPETWVNAVLGEAATLLGPWAEQPAFTQAHRWRFGRGNAVPLTSPIVVGFTVRRSA
jgi:renalase